MADWYYVRNGGQQGPVSLEALQQLVASGQLSPTDIVWTEGMSGWQAAAQAPGVLAAGPIPPPLRAMPIGYASAAPDGQRPRSLGDDPGARWLLPVGRSGWAIAAGYLGLLSFIIFPAPLALICAILALRDIRKHPDRHGMGRAIFGLIMGSLGTIALGFFIIGMMSHSATPHHRIGGY